MKIEEQMWVEKYRPTTLDDIVGHDETTDRLKEYADDAEIPHMILAGPPGVGKTASVVAFAREVYGSRWRKNVTEMNASDERGIDVIRDKVKGIARSTPAGGADYQILFLDEADQLTKDAQASLRRIMEQHSDVTRFFMSCNYPNQIIDAIQSRCSVFRFNRLDDDDIMGVLEHVANEEDLAVQVDAIEKLVKASNGDARKAINSLQSAAMQGEVTEDGIENAIGVVDPELVEAIVDFAIAGEYEEAMGMLDKQLIKKGANTNVMADTFLRVILDKNLPAPGKLKILSELSDVDWMVRQGANPNVQWHGFIAGITVAAHLDYGKYQGGQK